MLPILESPSRLSFVFRPLEHGFFFASKLFMSPKYKLKSALGIL